MKTFGNTLFAKLAAAAAASPRKRKNHNVHSSSSETVQRFFNAIQPGSYIRPHRHVSNWEFVLVVKGSVDLIRFDAAGGIINRTSLGPDKGETGYELEPGAWHSWVCTEADTVTLEIKPGPYDPTSAAEFAAWAPAEGDGGVPAFLDRMAAPEIFPGNQAADT